MCISKLILIHSVKLYPRLNYYFFSLLAIIQAYLSYQLPIIFKHHKKIVYIQLTNYQLSTTTNNQFKIRAINTTNRRNLIVTINHCLQQLATKQLTSQSNSVSTNITKSIPTIVSTGYGLRHCDSIDSNISISES